MNSKRENLVVGLDIGTTKICAIVGAMTEEGLDVVGIGTSPVARHAQGCGHQHRKHGDRDSQGTPGSGVDGRL